jgi:hypothetical protein
MTRRALTALLGAFILAWGMGAWAASEDEKRIFNGPSMTSFGDLQLVLGQGASAEAKFQPDTSKLTVKTLVGEARIITSAKNLILVESEEGRIEIILPNGRVIVVDPGKAEIVGRTLTDDAGNITIRLSGTGPIAALGGTMIAQGVATSGVTVTVLEFSSQALIDTQLTNDTSGRFCSECGVSGSTP